MLCRVLSAILVALWLWTTEVSAALEGVVATATHGMVIAGETAPQWLRNNLAGYEDAFTLNLAGESLRACPALSYFYRDRDFHLAWQDEQGPLPHADGLIRALQAAHQEGLDPADYYLPRIESLLGQVRHHWRAGTVTPAMAGELDALLSQAFLRYAAHLSGRRLDPSSVDPEWFAKRPPVDLLSVLVAAVTSEAVERTLQDLRPHHPGYGRLREALAHYRGIATKGGWPLIPPGPKLELHQHSNRVGLLRARLAAEGYLPNSPSSLFDEPVRQAVRTFQQTHGQEPTGVVGDATLDALNVPVAARIKQITINMERWRWLPHNLGRRHIMVNVAGYDMEVVENDHAVMAMKVVVGKPYLRTPVFSAELSYLVLSPYWNVPPTIAGKEILPAIRKDPNYLAKHDMEAVLRKPGAQGGNPAAIDWSQPGAEALAYRFRQRPGPKNPLGTVKFMLPNPFDVYLHDTSQRNLFSRTERVFSHGCIRIEKPMDLLEYVLGHNPRYDRKAVEEIIAAKRERIIGVPDPIPVHILYWTTWVSEDGKVHFRKDVYGRDKLLETALENPAAVGPGNGAGETPPLSSPARSG